jgi:protein SCO1/2
MRGLFAIAALALVLAALPAAAHQGPDGFDEIGALAASQEALGKPVSDHRFTAGDGTSLTLQELRGRPVMLSLIYTSCEHTCPLITQHLARAIEVADAALGSERFAVLTIGFDTKADTPARMRAYQASHAAARPGWWFLSADAATIESLAAEIGFRVTPRAGGFDHLAQVTVLDADGRVYRQVYGDDFPPQLLVEPLKELVFGRPAATSFVAGLLDRVRLLCTVYDPAADRYRFSYAIFVGLLIGAASLAGIAAFTVRLWRQSKAA